MGEIPESLAQILQAVEQTAVPHAELLKTIVTLGAEDTQEALEVLESLKDDGLLSQGT